MGEVHIDTAWRHHGLQAILMENALLRVEILPEAGAKIYSILHKLADHELLWHNPRVRPAACPPGTSFDDTWAGGWDDMFPSAVPEAWQGESLHDHGELWTQRWDWEIVPTGADEACVHLWCHTPLTPARFEKWLTLRDGESCLRVRYRVANLGARPFKYLWSLHPALPATPDSRIDLPAGEMAIDSWSLERFGKGHTRYRWPMAEGRRHEPIDISRGLPPDAGVADQHYAVDLREGWYAVTDRASRVGFGMVFPKEIFGTCWLFLTYGGWRGLSTIIVEPSTTWPGLLSEADIAGRAPALGAGGSLECEVLALAYAGIEGVTHITPDGVITPS